MSDVISFLKCLEEEAVYATIRVKTYPVKSHKVFFKNLISKKQKKIDSICLRNKLPNMFSDDATFMKIWEKIVGYGLPKFEYKNMYDLPIAMQKLEIVNNSVCLDNDQRFHVLTDVGQETATAFPFDKVDGDGKKVMLEKFAKVRSNEEIDTLFYFYPGSSFSIKGEEGVWELEEADVQATRRALLKNMEGIRIETELQNLRRIL